MNKNKLVILLSLQIFIISTILSYDFLSASNYLPLWNNSYKNSPISSNAVYYLGWDDNGTAICTEAGDHQEKPLLCSDGAGGAIIIWQDQRTGVTSVIFAQKVDYLGNVQWATNGEVICTASPSQMDPQICKNDECVI